MAKVTKKWICYTVQESIVPVCSTTIVACPSISTSDSRIYQSRNAVKTGWEAREIEELSKVVVCPML
jgi:hypothetical protein